jgi:ATP/maltotriose-dependent transcriptional regulator MalT
MGIRHWFRDRLLGDDTEGNDVPPGMSLVNTLLGREQERVRSLGEYRADSYPAEMADLVRRRSEVAREVLSIDVADPEARAAAIPRLQQLLRKYPHPLVYEMLIHAYVDSGRYDEAKGVAFAARERRLECARSPHPEVQAEIERLREWSPEEVDELRAEREARRQTGG